MRLARRRRYSWLGSTRPVASSGLLLSLVALLLVVAACGGGSSSPTEASAEQAAADGAAPAAAPAGDASAPDGVPGTREFGLTQEEFAAHVESVESLIATCMGDAGFEYVPADVDTVELAMSAVRVEPGYTRDEYKAEFGYGTTTRSDNPVKDIALGPQNQRIIDDLPETDRAAYERTLFGEDTGATFAFTLDEELFDSTGGCTREAIEQTFTAEQLSGAYVNPKDILVGDDPRMVEAQANWALCMQEDGFDYLDQDDVIEELEERLEALLDGGEPEDLDGPRLEQLQELQAEEIAISLLDVECQIDHIDDVEQLVETEILGATTE